MPRAKILRKGFCNKCQTQDIPSLMHAYCRECLAEEIRTRSRIRKSRLRAQGKCVQCSRDIRSGPSGRYGSLCKECKHKKKIADSIRKGDSRQKFHDFARCNKCDKVTRLGTLMDECKWECGCGTEVGWYFGM